MLLVLIIICHFWKSNSILLVSRKTYPRLCLGHVRVCLFKVNQTKSVPELDWLLMMFQFFSWPASFLGISNLFRIRRRRCLGTASQITLRARQQFQTYPRLCLGHVRVCLFKVNQTKSVPELDWLLMMFQFFSWPASFLGISNLFRIRRRRCLGTASQVTLRARQQFQTQPVVRAGFELVTNSIQLNQFYVFAN